MTKVFVGGSRRVSRLNIEVRRRLDRIIEQGLVVLLGDANGADKAIQKYLQSRGYERVEVFCSGGQCRNNLGNWPIRAVPAAQGRKDFDFYAAKDQQMAQEASVGFMIWDGRSAGTLTNIARLLRQHKKAVVYTVPTKKFSTLKDSADWEQLVAECEKDVRQKVSHAALFRDVRSGARQATLL
ncbi:MAG: hypothetical protein HY726_12375 [Candidatus Rokubacteria bacterium]|nr:hypothetical protein [Candidatus Rokubacteria bacterium]